MKGIMMAYSDEELIARLERLSLWQPLGHDNQTLIKHTVHRMKELREGAAGDLGISAALQAEITRLSTDLARERVAREAMDHALYLVVRERDELRHQLDAIPLAQADLPVAAGDDEPIRPGSDN